MKNLWLGILTLTSFPAFADSATYRCESTQSNSRLRIEMVSDGKLALVSVIWGSLFKGEENAPSNLVYLRDRNEIIYGEATEETFHLSFLKDEYRNAKKLPDAFQAIAYTKNDRGNVYVRETPMECSQD